FWVVLVNASTITCNIFLEAIEQQRHQICHVLIHARIISWSNIIGPKQSIHQLKSILRSNSSVSKIEAKPQFSMTIATLLKMLIYCRGAH
ncbi:hypothetical protein ACJX0J_028271, partial [Zea mays]